MANRIAHVYGAMRSVESATKVGASEPWGCRLNVLTEPDGDPLEITAFASDFPPSDVLALKGKNVHATVALDAQPGTRGGAFLGATLKAIQVVAVPSPEPVAAQV